MEVKFDNEKLMQLDTIKQLIKQDYKNHGFEEMPETVDDSMALEYAITFTAQLLFFRRFPELVDRSL